MGFFRSLFARFSIFKAPLCKICGARHCLCEINATLFGATELPLPPDHLPKDEVVSLLRPAVQTALWKKDRCSRWLLLSSYDKMIACAVAWRKAAWESNCPALHSNVYEDRAKLFYDFSPLPRLELKALLFTVNNSPDWSMSGKVDAIKRRKQVLLQCIRIYEDGTLYGGT